MLSQEEMIAYLHAKEKKLSKIFEQIDRDVKETVDLYLPDWKPSFPGERLTFSNFLSLLVKRVIEKTKVDWENAHVSIVKEALRKEVVKEFEESLAKAIPNDELHVVVYLEHEALKAKTLSGKEDKPVYQAFCLERMIVVSGSSVHDAMGKWLKNLRAKMRKGPISRFPIVQKGDRHAMYEESATLDVVFVERYTVAFREFKFP